jgi:Protein of unknown function (DUF3352)
MRRLRVALCLAGLALAAGCGGGEETGSGLPDSLGYVSRDAGAVAVVSTDLDSEQVRRAERLFEPSLREVVGDGSLRGALNDVFDDDGIDFERDVEPILAGTIVIALPASETEDGSVLFVLETTDGEKAQAVVDKLESGGGGIRVDGDTVLVSDEQELDAAIERNEAGTGFDSRTFTDALGDDVDEDRLIRLYVSPETITDLAENADLPWLAALQSVAATIELESDAVVGDLRVRTNPAGLTEDDLPLETGEDAPEVPDVDGALNGANRNQSRTTVFLAQLARKAYPDSRFVREVERLEADLGISFEEEVLKQFNGPSASIAYESGEFAAVSDVADPERMRALLPRLAPRLPPILRGLEGLGNEGLVALLLFAPDAPLVPGALRFLQDGVDVRRIGDLYEMRSQAFGAGGMIVFGLVGERFVVATDHERARQAAELEVSEVDDAEGAAVGRTDFEQWGSRRIELATGFDLQPLGEAVAQLEASTEGLEGEFRIEVPVGLD